MRIITQIYHCIVDLFGNWSFTMTTYDEEGKIEDTKEGGVAFSYVMDGMEFKMSHLSQKRRMDRGKIPLYGDYGTTIRVPNDR